MSRRPDDALWRVAFACPPDAANAFMAALEGPDVAVTAFDDPAAGTWRVEAIAPAPPDRAAMATRVALAAASLGLAPPEIDIEAVPPRDWLADSLASFHPLRIGRFVVVGAHHAKPPGRWALRIDAATAFGTGEHPTTQACLEALDALAKRRRLGRVLDLGTGSGLLAIAASRLGARRVLAVDNDSEAVRVAARHARLNRARLRVDTSDGYRSRAVRRGGPYDVVTANILAGPLAAMAPALARALAPGGVAILSGLLAAQERSVLVPHHRAGLRLAARRTIDGWTTLVMRRDQPVPTHTTSVSMRPSGWRARRR